MAAAERLSALQEVQMQLIESGTTSIDEVCQYLEALRHECALMFAARKSGLKVLAGCPVPTLSVCEAKAKQTIELHLYAKELKDSCWGNEPWSLTDLSQENWTAEPKGCFKKGAAVVEVTYDGDPSNAAWHTVWDRLYMRLESGWTLATGGVNAQGLYYEMQGERIFYSLFSDEAARYSSTGQYVVSDGVRVFCNPSSSVSLTSSDSSRPAGDASPNARCAEPDPSTASLPAEPCSRNSSFRLCGGLRYHPYGVSGGEGRVGSSSATEHLQAKVQTDSASSSEAGEKAPAPDSTDLGFSSTSSVRSPRSTVCLLISGTGNQVKCCRFRYKKGHRRRYKDISTTWWWAGENGSERVGEATVLLTFTGEEQRKDFLSTVHPPAGVTFQPLTMTFT